MNRDNNLFSFYLALKGDDKNVFKCNIGFGKYRLSYSPQTYISKASNKDSELIILGDAVDLHSGKSLELAHLLLENVSDIQSLINREYYIGGKYVVFYRCHTNYYIIGDATCSIPINYTYLTDHGLVCASNLWDIIMRCRFEKDEHLLRIRNGGDVYQAMPFDYTVYKEVKQLLPNHYLEATSEKVTASRFINQPRPKSSVTPEEAAKRTAPWIKIMTKFYTQRYDVCCPITSGRDSRVVLAFLRNLDKSVPCFTMRHESHSGKEQDLVIPVELCRKMDLSHNQIEDVHPSEEMLREVNATLGDGVYAPQTLKIANTVQTFCQGRAILNGDIIGQVGKCSLHRDVPQSLASPSYFMCKLHNYSKEAKKALKEWLDEIRGSQETVSAFDLFSVENRMGRWAAQENLIYNTIGQHYLNIFNSRCIIYMWTRVPRKVRKLSSIHIELIKLIDKDLLDVTFEVDNNLVRLAKSSGFAYYCASFLKYWVQGYQYWTHKENK